MQYKELATNPVAVVLQLVGAKWKILIITELLKKNLRFSELKNRVGCTAKILSNCLKELEEDGLIEKIDYKTHPPKVEYFLTDIGKTLLPVVEAMREWGKDYKKLIKLLERRG